MDEIVVGETGTKEQSNIQKGVAIGSSFDSDPTETDRDGLSDR